MRNFLCSRRTLRAALFGMAVVGTGVASAGVTTYTGKFNDQANAALVGTDATSSSTLFDNDQDIANNTALYQFTVAFSGNVNFTSASAAIGGTDPYFSLFSGPIASATFVDSNYNQATTTGGDFSITDHLAAGTYTIAIGVNENLSIAENYGTGMLSDGFSGIGEDYNLGDSDGPNDYLYSVQVTTPDAIGPGGPGDPGQPGNVIPEPAPLMLMGVPLLAWTLQRRRLATYRRSRG